MSVFLRTPTRQPFDRTNLPTSLRLADIRLAIKQLVSLKTCPSVQVRKLVQRKPVYISLGEIIPLLPKFLEVVYRCASAVFGRKGDNEAPIEHQTCQTEGTVYFILGGDRIWRYRCRTSPITVKRRLRWNKRILVLFQID